MVAAADRSGKLFGVPKDSLDSPCWGWTLTLARSPLRGPSVSLRKTSPHRPSPLGPPGRRAAALLLRLACVALLGWIGYIHLHLWLEGYRQIPTDGPLFLLDAVAGFAIGAGLLVRPAALTGLLATGYTAATLGALLISLTVGLFGFRESISASYVAQSLTIEAITVLALLSWTVLVTATPWPPAADTTGTKSAGAHHARH